MKFLVNISSIIIMMLSFSSITSAQNQQRPSQRSFAMVLSKIKEKKSGRDRMQREQQQPEHKVEKIDPVATQEDVGTTNTHQQPKRTNPKTLSLPSRQNMQVPGVPKKH